MPDSDFELGYITHMRRNFRDNLHFNLKHSHTTRFEKNAKQDIYELCHARWILTETPSLQQLPPKSRGSN